MKHHIVIRILNDKAGRGPNCFDQSILKQHESSDGQRECCPLCKSNFGGRYMLLRHLADCHFRERLCQGLQQGDVFKCPACSHESKDKGGFVRHYGLVHKMVLKYAEEMGIKIDDESTKKGGNGSVSGRSDQELLGNMESFEGEASSDYQMHSRASDTLSQSSAEISQDYSSASAHFSPSQQSFRPQSQSSSMDAQILSPTSMQTQSPRTISRQSFDGYNTQPPQQQFQSPRPTPTQQHETFFAPQVQQQQQPMQQAQPQSQSQPQQQQQQPLPPFSQAQNTPLSPSYHNAYAPQTPTGAPPQSPYQPQQQQHLQQDAHPNATSTSVFNSGQHSFQGIQQEQPQVHQHNPDLGQQQQQQQHAMVPPSSHQAPQQVQFHHSQTGVVQHHQQPMQRPVVLQQQPQRPHMPQGPTATPAAPPQPSSSKGKGTFAPEDFIENPDPGVLGPYGIQCRNCHNVSKTKSDFYRHLSERHYKADLAKELPRAPPFKCPFTECTYETKDHSIAPLIKHYGIVHKAVQKYLAGKIVGKFVPFDKKGPQQGGSKNVALQQHPQQLNRQLSNADAQQYEMTTTMSNTALNIRCPFCDLFFANRYGFHQHLCDKHFKDTLAQQVPAQPPWACPAVNCHYIAKDSRQSLIRHYGMTHRKVMELLKKNAPPGFIVTEPVPQQPKQPLPSMSEHAHGYQPPAPPQQHQVQYEYQPPQQVVPARPDLTAPQANEFYQDPQLEYQLHSDPHHMQLQQQQQQQQQPMYHQPPQYDHQMQPASSAVGGHLMPQQQQGQLPGTFDHQQIDGTVDPSLYSGDSLDGIKSLPSTPVKEASLKSTSPVSNASSAPSAPSTSSSNSTAASSTSSNGSASSVEKTNGDAVKAEFTKPTKSKPPPKFCEVCGKVFEGKNKAMLKIQHLAQHFKNKLFEDLPNKTSPFTCPVEGCLYQTKHKPDWARHYGSVHKYIDKYLKEYLATNPVATPVLKSEAASTSADESSRATTTVATPAKKAATTTVPPPPAQVQAQPMPTTSTGQVTIREFLPKAELSQILSTAIDQQRQTDKNFGVVTIQGTPLQMQALQQNQLQNQQKQQQQQQLQLHQEQQQQQQIQEQHIKLEPQNHQLDLIDEMLQGHNDVADVLGVADEKPGEPAKLQCFMCDDGEEFKSEEELNSHITNCHFDVTEEFQLTGEKLTLLSTADVEAAVAMPGAADVSIPAVQDVESLPAVQTAPPPPYIPPPQVAEAETAPPPPPPVPPAATASTSMSAPVVDRKNGGRPCELCGYEPKTKNKSRERSDHLAMKHYKDRIEKDLSKIVDLTCPICSFKGKDKQTIYRHYTGKHRVVEKYLADDLAAGRVVPLAAKQQKTQQSGQQQVR